MFLLLLLLLLRFFFLRISPFWLLLSLLLCSFVFLLLALGNSFVSHFGISLSCWPSSMLSFTSNCYFCTWLLFLLVKQTLFYTAKYLVISIWHNFLQKDYDASHILPGWRLAIFKSHTHILCVLIVYDPWWFCGFRRINTSKHKSETFVARCIQNVYITLLTPKKKCALNRPTIATWREIVIILCVSLSSSNGTTSKNQVQNLEISEFLIKMYMKLSILFDAIAQLIKMNKNKMENIYTQILFCLTSSARLLKYEKKVIFFYRWCSQMVRLIQLNIITGVYMVFWPFNFLFCFLAVVCVFVFWRNQMCTLLLLF